MLSHSFFLLEFQDNLQGRRGMRLNSFVSLSTIEWSVQLLLLGQFQNSIELIRFLLKNSLSSLDIADDWI